MGQEARGDKAVKRVPDDQVPHFQNLARGAEVRATRRTTLRVPVRRTFLFSALRVTLPSRCTLCTHTTIIIIIMKTWFLLIDHNFKVVGDAFSVDSTGDSTIEDLKERAKEKMPEDLSHIAPIQLTVWRCIDPTFFNFRNRKVLAGQISDVFSNERVEPLGGIETIAELNIPKKEILLVTLPGQPVVASGQVGAPITSQVDREYEHCFLKAHSKGGFTEADIQFNGIMDRDNDNDDRDAPEFVKKYKQMLARKRKVADNMRGTAADIVDGGDDYFDYSTANVPAVVAKQEVIHVGQISSLYFGEHWELRNNGNTTLFKECDANWLFFYAITLQIKSRPSSITPRLSVKL
ncbi:hypothetical protein EDB86DRAFT_122144 [Lactarius hatsudake]|nr:hypothetical protein EDB86DRAFT_122144 [Lactarius hatsudake]